MPLCSQRLLLELVHLVRKTNPRKKITKIGAYDAAILWDSLKNNACLKESWASFKGSLNELGISIFCNCFVLMGVI